MLLTKTALSSLLHGVHYSPITGEGNEFSQYRPYQPGDDPRLIDWKVFARRKKYYIKQSEPPKTATITIQLDNSASMNHQSMEHSKWEYALWLTAQLSFLSLQQSDKLNIITNQGQWPPAGSQLSEYALVHYLSGIKAVGNQLPALAANIADLQVVISDLYDENDEWKAKVRQERLSSKGDFWVLHLISPEEINPSLLGNTAVLKDLESGQQVELDKAELVSAGRRFAKWQEHWKSYCASIGVRYFPVVTDSMPVEVLNNFVHKQNSRYS